jgi:hypothetical protein
MLRTPNIVIQAWSIGYRYGITDTRVRIYTKKAWIQERFEHTVLTCLESLDGDRCCVVPEPLPHLSELAVTKLPATQVTIQQFKCTLAYECMIFNL